MKLVIVLCDNKVIETYNIVGMSEENAQAIARRVVRNLIQQKFPRMKKKILDEFESGFNFFSHTDFKSGKKWHFAIDDSVYVGPNSELVEAPPQFEKEDYYSSSWQAGMILCNRKFAIDKIIGVNEIFCSKEEKESEVARLKEFNVFNEDGELLYANDSFEEVKSYFEEYVERIYKEAV